MRKLYYVDIQVTLSRYAPLMKGKREGLREMSVSLPILDKVRAEQMMDHLAKRLKEAFEEVESRDQIDRQAAQASGIDGLRMDGGGDDGQALIAPAAEESGHISPCGNTVGESVPTGAPTENPE